MTDHILKTPADCDCNGEGHCVICDGGLAHCKVCGLGEVQLDETPECPGPANPEDGTIWTWPNGEMYCFKKEKGGWVELTIQEHCDLLATLAGFENTEDFLGYVEIHSETERAMFSGTQIGTIIKMSDPNAAGEYWLDNPSAFRSIDLRHYVEKVRERLKPKPEVVDGATKIEKLKETLREGTEPLSHEKCTCGDDELNCLYCGAAEKIDRAMTRAAEYIGDLEDVLEDKRRLTREIDVAMHGEEGAAEQASLCDLIGPARRMRIAITKLMGVLCWAVNVETNQNLEWVQRAKKLFDEYEEG